jgi:hypothetical protein
MEPERHRDQYGKRSHYNVFAAGHLRCEHPTIGCLGAACSFWALVLVEPFAVFADGTVAGSATPLFINARLDARPLGWSSSVEVEAHITVFVSC